MLLVSKWNCFTCVSLARSSSTSDVRHLNRSVLAFSRWSIYRVAARLGRYLAFSFNLYVQLLIYYQARYLSNPTSASAYSWRLMWRQLVLLTRCVGNIWAFALRMPYLNVGEEKTIGTLHGCYSQFLIEKNVPGICREFPPSLSWKIVVKWIAVGMQRAEVYGRQESINLETDKVSIRSRDERSSGIRLCATISAVHKRRR